MNNLKVETQIKLNRFKPREYQLPICKAFEKGFKKLLVVMPRRAGKDIVAFNLMIRAALQRVGTYFYLLPNAVQARRVMFDGITMAGSKMLSFIPEALIEKINIQEMKITLKNGSIIQFGGSENFDRLRGTNPAGCVFSEYAFQHPEVYPTLRPALLANDGWSIFISTPFSENHFYTLYQVAQESPDWYVSFQTIEDTGHISKEDIEGEIERGEMSWDMAQQEYFCSFSRGARGSFYETYLNSMELEHRIGSFDWEPAFPVHTAWDLGVSDETVILFFQCIGRTIHIIDLYCKNSVGLEHYINVVQSKPYTYGKHIGPHDLAVREFTAGGLTRLEKAAQLGIKFIVAPKLSIIDGIESVRSTLPRTRIDDTRCKDLIRALKNYRKEYDSKNDRYSNKPVHDKSSNYADALRYLCVSLPKIQTTNSTPEELEKRYQRARYGAQADMPAIFRDDLPNY